MGLRKFPQARQGLLIVLILALLPVGGCRQGDWPLWEAFNSRFVDAQGRVVDHSHGDRTTSLAQAYALFFALVGDDRAAFDSLLNWTRTNMAQGDLAAHLPGRLWQKGADGEWQLQDTNSAPDADVWMAYTLMEAGRLWSAPAYTTTGRAMMAQIADSEVANLPGFGPLLMPGPNSFQHEQTWLINPSSMPLFLFQRFAAVDPSGPWQQIAANIPRMIELSARHGYAMDWVAYVPGDGFFPALNPAAINNESDTPGGSEDAIRVYLWAGMISGSGNLRAQVLNSLPGMSVYLADHDAPPERVSDQGIPLPQDGPVGFSAALLPYLRAFPNLARFDPRETSQQTVRMAKMRNPLTGLYGKEMAYDDQVFALFSTGYLGDRFRFGSGGELIVKWER
jgi:endoglucanase